MLFLREKSMSFQEYFEMTMQDKVRRKKTYIVCVCVCACAHTPRWQDMCLNSILWKCVGKVD